MKKLAWIGLGIMGKPMAKNLLQAGFPLWVYDRNLAAMAELSHHGATATQSVADAVSTADVIITMLPDSPHVEEVALGQGGILDSAHSGVLYLDMSSIAPASSVKIGQQLQKKNIRMLDAPVSGGEPKAIDGTLAIMAGGEEADFHEAEAIFSVLGSSARLVGKLGAGNICKLVNQVIVAGNIAAVSEGMALAVRSGADPEKVFDAISGGLAGSTVLNAKVPKILTRSYEPGFRIDLHIKDLKNAISTAADCDAALPFSAQLLKIMEHLHDAGYGGEDHSALYRYYETENL